MTGFSNSDYIHKRNIETEMYLFQFYNWITRFPFENPKVDIRLRHTVCLRGGRKRVFKMSTVL